MKFYTTFKISENIHETPEGFLVCLAVPIARTGEMIYGEGESPLETEDGKAVVTRSEDEVFRGETVASFEGKAITITHPGEFVSPENWSRLAKGVLQNVRRGEGDQNQDLLSDLLITDSLAINLVKSGLREVSCGYEAEYVQTGPGRGIQRNIIGNHLALVDEGRAGSAYAINDHKGAEKKMELKNRIRAIFAKAQDDAMAAADADAPPKEKEKGAKDAAPPEKKDEKKDDKKPAMDAGAYDELVQMVKDLGSKISSMGAKDVTAPASNSEPAVTVAKDDEPGAEKSLEDRLSAIEAAVAKLMENMAAKAGDADEDMDESEDDDFEESTMTGDSASDDDASRVEILAPGMKATGKDVKKKAILAAYGTQDGKKVLDVLTGGKVPVLDSAEKVDTFFIAASELLKSARTSEFAGTKTVRDSTAGTSAKGPVSAEDLNAINAKHYGSAAKH